MDIKSNRYNYLKQTSFIIYKCYVILSFRTYILFSQRLIFFGINHGVYNNRVKSYTNSTDNAWNKANKSPTA